VVRPQTHTQTTCVKISEWYKVYYEEGSTITTTQLRTIFRMLVRRLWNGYIDHTNWRSQMEQVVRKIVGRKSITSVFIPEDFGEFVEIIVFPAKKEKKISADSEAMIKLQEKSGFVNQVLADEKEDVWNEL